MEKNGMKCILFIHEHNCNDISYFEYVNIKPNNSYSFKRMCLYSSFIRETNKKNYLLLQLHSHTFYPIENKCCTFHLLHKQVLVFLFFFIRFIIEA